MIVPKPCMRAPYECVYIHCKEIDSFICDISPTFIVKKYSNHFYCIYTSWDVEYVGKINVGDYFVKEPNEDWKVVERSKFLARYYEV